MANFFATPSTQAGKIAKGKGVPVPKTKGKGVPVPKPKVKSKVKPKARGK